jgi:hypothetical protein
MEFIILIVYFFIGGIAASVAARKTLDFDYGVPDEVDIFMAGMTGLLVLFIWPTLLAVPIFWVLGKLFTIGYK